VDSRTPGSIAYATMHARLGIEYQLEHPSVANCDTVQLVAKSRLERRVGELDAGQTERLGHALRFALALDA
jgi:mRNA-degrading endonuclease toxin of MazEF toxin-antitoxin module